MSTKLTQKEKETRDALRAAIDAMLPAHLRPKRRKKLDLKSMLPSRKEQPKYINPGRVWIPVSLTTFFTHHTCACSSTFSGPTYTESSIFLEEKSGETKRYIPALSSENYKHLPRKVSWQKKSIDSCPECLGYPSKQISLLDALSPINYPKREFTPTNPCPDFSPETTGDKLSAAMERIEMAAKLGDFIDLLTPQGIARTFAEDEEDRK